MQLVFQRMYANSFKFLVKTLFDVMSTNPLILFKCTSYLLFFAVVTYIVDVSWILLISLEKNEGQLSRCHFCPALQDHC